MKTFRQSFWKASSTSAFLLCAIGCAACTGIAAFSQSLWGTPVWYFLLFVTLILLLLLLMFKSQYFYIIIDDKNLTFQNSIQKSARHTFPFQDISLIHIENPGGRSNVYVDVYLKEKNLTPRFTIESVPASSYAQIIALLREKGLEVRATNLDPILQRQAKKHQQSA